jgi:hypothetical protein
MLFFRRISEQRAVAATDSLNMLQVIVRDYSEDSKLTNTQATLSETFDIDQIYHIMDLGCTIEDIIMARRFVKAPEITTSHPIIYDQQEKNLW